MSIYGRQLISACVVALIFANSQALAARSSELVSPSSTSRPSGNSSTGDGGECDDKGNFCLPKNIFDDDPTEGGKYSECETLSGILAPRTIASTRGDAGDQMCHETNRKSASLKPVGTVDRRQEALYRCLNQVRESIPSGNIASQKNFISNFKSARLKTFLAMAFTGYGEAGPDMGIQDIMAIQKTVVNRTKSCVNGKEPSATAWEVAIAEKQFSMYNDKIYGKNGDKFIKEKEDSSERMKKSISSFLDLQCARFTPPEMWDKVSYYHNNQVNPSWNRKMKLVQPAAVDGKTIQTTGVHHKFYAKEWSCDIDEVKTVASNSSKRGRKKSDASNSSVSARIAAFWNGLIPRALAAIEDWTILNDTKIGHLLRNTRNPLNQIQVTGDPDGAKILSVKTHPTLSDLDIVEYDAGVHGTSQLVQLYRAVIVNNKTNEILGDYPLRSVALNTPASEQPAQPKWSVEGAHIKIYSPDTAKTYTVDAGE